MVGRWWIESERAIAKSMPLSGAGCRNRVHDLHSTYERYSYTLPACARALFRPHASFPAHDPGWRKKELGEGKSVGLGARALSRIARSGSLRVGFCADRQRTLSKKPGSVPEVGVARVREAANEEGGSVGGEDPAGFAE